MASFECDAWVYKPECLLENEKLTKMTHDVLPKESVAQYVNEEHSLLAKRAANESQRLRDLLTCVNEDHTSTEEKIDDLKSENPFIR